jgi:PIN domain nuclease of toxin-antitoxin system
LRLLLDTHVLVWAADPELNPRISDVAGSAIEDPRNEILVSAASSWEVATKFRIGRLAAGERIVRDWRFVMSELSASDLPITSEHGLLAGGFDADNRDPFDRILAAQAIVEGAQLVTADRAMNRFGAELLW